jgi:hypothetical protein
MSLLDLEATIRKLPGVLGCVIVADPAGEPSEVQAFTDADADRSKLQRAIFDETTRRGMGGSLRQVLVFELEAEALMGGPESLRQAELLAELEALDDESSPGGAPLPPGPIESSPVRPVLQRVVATLRSSAAESEVEVALVDGETAVIGQAVGRQSAHGLNIVAQATIDAVHKMVGEGAGFTLEAICLTELNENEIVMVLVGSPEGEMVGAALVRGGPHADAAVRATLDALNRRLTRMR